MDGKILFGILSVIVAVVTVLPYIRDMFRGETKPHIFSWFLWGFSAWIVTAAQIWDDAGPGMWAMLTTSVVCTFVFILSFRYGTKNITRSDTVMLSVGLLAIPAWALTGHPLLSVIIISGIDVVAFGPTMRKSWAKPHEESLSLYVLGGTWQAFSILAMENYTWVTTLSPASLVICESSFAAYLFIRRYRLKRSAHG